MLVKALVNLIRPRFIWNRGLQACMRGYLALMEARDLSTVGGIIPWAGLNKKEGERLSSYTCSPCSPWPPGCRCAMTSCLRISCPYRLYCDPPAKHSLSHSACCVRVFYHMGKSSLDNDLVTVIQGTLTSCSWGTTVLGAHMCTLLLTKS